MIPKRRAQQFYVDGNPHLTMHLHFAAATGGADTLVYGYAGKTADAILLKGITIGVAEGNMTAFVIGTDSTV